MDNFLRRSNADMQGIPVLDNENVKSLVMNTYKLTSTSDFIDPRIHRNSFVSFRRMKSTGKAEDNKKVFNSILVKFRTFEHKIMKEKIIGKC